MRKQKILAALLALVMVVTLLPLTAFAVESEETAGGEPSAMAGQEEAAGPKPVNHESSWPTITNDKNQPFHSGIPYSGSGSWRIPNIITSNGEGSSGTAGTLYAAADANWNQSLDGGNIDVVFATSTDNGQTWKNKYIFYFDDCNEYSNWASSTFMDPVTVQDSTGRIYVLADCYPGDVAIQTVSARYTPAANDNGYREVDSKQRIVLFSSPIPNQQTDWTHYIGDFDEVTGFAPVIPEGRSADDAVAYVDHWYYLYDEDYNPVQCKQYGKGGGTNGKGTPYHTSDEYTFNGDEKVQANVFFYQNAEFDSDGNPLGTPLKLHVRGSVYLWLRYSDDGGATWSAPSILNPEVYFPKSSQTFLGVGPGRGETIDVGGAERIIFPVYEHPTEVTKIIYSDNRGATWNIGSYSQTGSEAAIAKVGNTLYMLGRKNSGIYSSTDGVNWSYFSSQPPGIISDCQRSAIGLPYTVDGKEAILVAAGTGNTRANGKVWIGLLNDGGSKINWKYSYDIKDGQDFGNVSNMFAYSSITVLGNGNVGLLWEDYYQAGQPWAIGGMRYDEIPIHAIAPTALIDGRFETSIKLYEELDLSFSFITEDTVIDDCDRTMLEVTSEPGRLQIVGVGEGKTTFTVDDVEFIVTVTPPSEDDITNVELKVGGVWTDTVSGSDAEIYGSSAQVEQETTGASTVVVQQASSAETADLSTALYTLNENSTYWNVSGEMASGQKVYLHFQKGLTSYPQATTPGEIKFQDATSNYADLYKTFMIWDASTMNNRNVKAGTHIYFDNNTGMFNHNYDEDTSTHRTSYYLITPEQNSSVELGDLTLKNYKALTSLSELAEDMKILIVARNQWNGYYCVLYPSSSTSVSNSHYAKLLEQDLSANRLTVTGETSGVTDVVVDGHIYRFNVTYTPKKPTVDGLGENIVSFVCENQFDAETYDYGKIDADNAVTFDWQEESEDATATIHLQQYLDKLNAGNDVVHQLAEGESNIVTVKLTWNGIDGTWDCEELPAIVNVTCNAKSTAPDNEQAAEIIGKVTVSGMLGEAKCEHDSKVYTLTADDVDVTSGENVHQDGDEYSVEVVIKVSGLVERYNGETGGNHTGGSDINVTLVYNADAKGWELKAGEDSKLNVALDCNSTSVPQPPVTAPATPTATPTAPAEPDTDIPDDSTPLAPAPEDDGDTDISDTDTPLDSTPKTGDASIAIAVLWSIFSMSAVGFVSVMLGMKKSGKHSK